MKYAFIHYTAGKEECKFLKECSLTQHNPVIIITVNIGGYNNWCSATEFELTEEDVVAFTLRFGDEVRYPNGNPAFVLTNNYTPANYLMRM